MIALNLPRPDFRVGQLIHHRRYGYRGLIVAMTVQCKAPDDWYQSNQTQPDRQQPWYHVLVHGSEAVTYAAQSSLMNAPEIAPISHPLVAVFFEAFDETSGYWRNSRPWPDGD